MNSILNDLTEFNRLLLQDLHSVVIQKIQSAGLDPDTVLGLSEVFDPNSLYGKPFQGLETQYLQQKYFRENFSMVVSRILIIYWFIFTITPTIPPTHVPPTQGTRYHHSGFRAQDERYWSEEALHWGPTRNEIHPDSNIAWTVAPTQNHLDRGTLNIACMDTGSSIYCTEILLFSSNWELQVLSLPLPFMHSWRV